MNLATVNPFRTAAAAYAHGARLIAEARQATTLNDRRALAMAARRMVRYGRQRLPQ